MECADIGSGLAVVAEPAALHIRLLCRLPNLPQCTRLSGQGNPLFLRAQPAGKFDLSRAMTSEEEPAPQHKIKMKNWKLSRVCSSLDEEAS